MSISSLLGAYLVVVLALGAGHKIIAPERPLAGAAKLLMIDTARARALVGLAAIMEGAAAIALLLPGGLATGSYAALGLWSAYALAAALAWARGDRRFDCGCTLVATPASDVRLIVLRAATLAALAAILPMLADGTPIGDPRALAAATAFAALSFAATQLLGSGPVKHMTVA